jgi:hypothetical protein
VNDHLYEFTRTSFGLKSSGLTFIRCLQEILDPIASFISAYVDDMAVHSHTWQDHLVHLDTFLQTIQHSGLTLNIRKCKLAMGEVRFCGQIVG